MLGRQAARTSTTAARGGGSVTSRRGVCAGARISRHLISRIMTGGFMMISNRFSHRIIIFRERGRGAEKKTLSEFFA
jgi:hypothetical protein